MNMPARQATICTSNNKTPSPIKTINHGLITNPFARYKKHTTVALFIYWVAICLIASATFTLPAFANVKLTVDDPSKPIHSLKNLSSNISKTNPNVNTPNIIRFNTSKGARVLFVASKELPIVDVAITFNAGAARDQAINPKAQGIANLTAAMLNKGTTTKTENELAQTIEKYGLVYSAAAYKDMFMVSLRSLSSPTYLKPAIKTFNDILVNSVFPEKALERLKAQTMIGLKQASERPSSIAKNAFMKQLYGKHPYALSSKGTLLSVPNINQAMLIEFRNKFLVANNASIAITGNLTTAQAKKLAEDITKDMYTGKAAAKLPKPKKPKARHIHIPFDSNQTTILAGHLGVARKNSNIYNLTVANDIFGGGNFQALLMTELRKKRGLTYGAYSGFTPMQVTGPFSISFSTRNDKAKQALKVTKKTLKRYLIKGASHADIEETKLSIVNKFPLSLATNKNINNMLSMMAFYQMPKDYLENYTLNINAVTKHSANTAFKDKVSLRNMIIVTVGPKKP